MTALTAFLLSTLLLAMARSSAAQGTPCSVCIAGYGLNSVRESTRWDTGWPGVDCVVVCKHGLNVPSQPRTREGDLSLERL